jgi:hypothetical protein
LEDEKEREIDREMRLNQVYLAIISRYKDYIEEREHISIAELPTLVTPASELVVKKADELKSAFGTYSYDSHFYEVGINSFYFVKDKITDISMPIQFWMTPEETISFGMGDLLDRNILLCSLLIALGNPSAKVLVYTKEDVRKVFTYYEFGGKAYMLDFAKGFKRYENRAAMIKTLDLNKEDVSYEFNNNMYIDII